MKIKIKRRTLTRVIPALAAAAALFTIIIRGVLPPTHVTVHVFNVGQGDAILIQDGFTEMLVDGGPDDTILAKLGETLPFFDHTIETVVLTHPHADHFVGLIGVLKRYNVRTIITDGRVSKGDPEYRRFEEAAKASGAAMLVTKDGDRVMLGHRASLAVLWQPRDPAQAEGLSARDENTWSIVMRLEAARAAGYLMGEAPIEVERRLVAANRITPADFLKVGHHGSRYSTSNELLGAVHPKYAAIPVGKNSYGHPTWTALRRLETHDSLIWRTDRDGDVIATFKDGAVMMQPKKEVRHLPAEVQEISDR